ncbi:CBS domain-containing protein [Actinophytocola sp.]|uniref:restriction system modified-DNA reader domain-containing protein n=1 Tax=Actinophytocola sp. TaxID=1872138 RepID=UPI003D6A3C92
MSERALDGRRESVRDLLEADLIRAGDRLRFTRPRAGEEHEASVSPEGRIVLSDGTEYDTPSDAAKAVANTQVNSWIVWRTDANRTLASLRNELRDAAAGDATAYAPHEYLSDIGEQLRAGEAITITVRELLRHWNARNRGTRITRRIEKDIGSHGLKTFPHFRDVALDTPVRFSIVDDEHEAKLPDESVLKMHTLASTDSDPDEDETPQIGLKVGNLPSALGGITSVTPESTVEQAITLMQIDDFSQLPVLSTNKRKLEGAVTWKSIAIARHIDPRAILRHCVIDAPEISYDQELVDVLSVLQSVGFVFVRNEVNEVNGIVTATDLAHAYGDMATPFFLIGELDQLLRHIVRSCIPLAEVVALCDSSGSREITSFDQLTIGDYERTLQNPGAWERLNTKLDRALFCARLGTLREIRNDIMHFNPEDIPTNTVEMLRNLLRMIRLNMPV